MALYCPVTGLEVFSHPDWINQHVSDTFIANFWIIGNSILYSSPSGYADLEGVRNSLMLNDQVASFAGDKSTPYTQIEDYIFLKGSSVSARRFFSKNMNNDNRRLSIVFCNLSPQLSMAVKLGTYFNTTGKGIYITKSYKTAIKEALALNSPINSEFKTAPIELPQYLEESNPNLVPIEVLSDDDWEIRTDEFQNKSVIINRSVMHSSSKGYLDEDHIPLVTRVRHKCQEAISKDAQIKYIVVDAKGLKGGSRQARIKYMQSLKKWHQRFPLRLYIIYGANTFMKTALNLSRPVLPFKLKCAKDVGHAFNLIEHDIATRGAKAIEIRDHEKAATVSHKDIDKLISLMGKIDWEQEGLDNDLDFDDSHPLFFLYQSIKLVKEELDDLFKDRKRLESQLFQSRKMESIGTMAGGIAHDFNNILHAMLGNAEMALRETDEGHPSRYYLQGIETACHRASKIVKHLLNFSRKAEQEFKPIDAIAIIKDSLLLLRSTIPSTIDIHQRLPDTEISIIADPVLINQLLINICSNASQAMEETGGVLEIKVENVVLTEKETHIYQNLKPGIYLRITISDTGPGIAPEIIDRIFDPYFTTKPAGKGSGMGLAVAHGIVQNHNGAITVDSQLGKGALFSIFFKVVSEKPVIDENETDETPLGNEKILFIDDEEAIVNIVEKMLQRLGYTVKATMNPLEALALFRSDPARFDLVITDMTMPKMSGVELYKELIKIRSDIPVIICTGYSSLIDEEEASALGISACVHKPVGLRELAQTIRNVLDAKKGPTQD